MPLPATVSPADDSTTAALPTRTSPPVRPSPAPEAAPEAAPAAVVRPTVGACPCPVLHQLPVLTRPLPPPPPLVDVSRFPRAILLPDNPRNLPQAVVGGPLPVDSRCPPPASCHQPYAEPRQPYVSHPLPDFPEDPSSLGGGGSVQGSHTLLSPGPELLDPELWVSLSPIERSLALVHIRGFFADKLDAVPSIANDAGHLLSHATSIMRLMDDSSDPDALVELGRDTIHQTALKAGWSLAAGLQHRHQH
ncbi:hypothetical protein DIPPA_05487 [Diplonema papillatum]|nr:hypothetical protein DIPPA_05487 [Diplonema papillatum]